MGWFDWLRPKNKSVFGSSQFALGHDFPTVDSWHKQRSPQKLDLLAQYEDVVFTCANFNAAAVGSTKLGLYIKNGSGQKTRWECSSITKGHKDFLRHKFSLNAREDVVEVDDPSHPYRKLLCHPNPDLDGTTFLELLQLFQEIVGTAYINPVLNGLGVPQSLWLLPPQFLRAQKDNINGYITHYQYTVNGNTRDYQPEEIIKCVMPNPLDIKGEGMSPLRAIWEPLLIANKVLAHEAALLDNQAKPSAIASIKDGAGEKEADRMEWRINNKFRKAGNGGIAVLEEDTTITPLGWSPKDLGMLQLLQVTKTQIANAYGVPLAFLDTENVNRANMVASQELHVKNAVARRLRRIENIFNEKISKLFDPSGRTFVAFDNPNPADRDFELQKMTTLATAANTLVLGQVWTPNEAREEFGLDPIEGGDDLRLMPGEVPTSSDNVSADVQATPDNTTTADPMAQTPQGQDINTSPALAMNGAQVTAALEIVTQVAQGQLPRDSGIGALQTFFNLTPEQAEQVMGDVGRGFTPAPPEGKSHDCCGDHKAHKPSKVAPPLPSGKELADILKKHFERQRKATLRSITKGMKALPDKFVPLDQWTEELATDCQPVCEIFYKKNYENSSLELVQRVGINPDVFNVTNPHAKKVLEQMVYEFAESTVQTTSKDINDAIEQVRQETLQGLVEHGEDIAQLTKRIETIFDSAERFRSQRIAQSEASRFHHEGQRQAAIDSGVVKGFKLMLSSNPCEKCVAQAAQGMIPLDGSFSLGEGVFASQILPVHPNCECALEEVLDIRA